MLYGDKGVNDMILVCRELKDRGLDALRFFYGHPDENPYYIELELTPVVESLPLTDEQIEPNERAMPRKTLSLLLQEEQGVFLLVRQSGSGKTTAQLKAFCDDIWATYNQSPPLVGYVPCWVDCRKRVPVDDREARTWKHVYSYIAETLPGIQRDNLEKMIENSPPLLFFFDLNEAPYEDQFDLASGIISFSERLLRHQNPASKVIIAYRSPGLEEERTYMLLRNFVGNNVWRVLPLDERSILEHYKRIRRMLGQITDGGELSRLSTSLNAQRSLFELPIRLYLLSIVGIRRIEDRKSFYAEMINYMLQRTQLRVIDSPETVRRLLQHIAVEMLKNRQTSVTKGRLCGLIRELLPGGNFLIATDADRANELISLGVLTENRESVSLLHDSFISYFVEARYDHLRYENHYKAARFVAEIARYLYTIEWIWQLLMKNPLFNVGGESVSWSCRSVRDFYLAKSVLYNLLERVAISTPLRKARVANV